MFKILNTDLNRKRNLLLLFDHYENEWISLSEIKKKQNCSTKTIKTDINYFESEWNQVLTFIYSEKKGYKLEIEENHSLLEVFQSFANESLFFSILEECLYERSESNMDYIVEKYFVSESTVKRTIKEINLYLSDIGGYVDYYKANLTTTNEQRIRIMFTIVLLEKHNFYDWPFEIEQEKLFDLSKKIEKELGIKLSNKHRNVAAYFMTVCIIRCQRNHHVEEEPYFSHQHYREAEQLIREEAPIKLTDIEVKDLTLSLFIFFGKLKMKSNDGKSQKFVKSLVESILNLFYLKVDCIDNEYIKKSGLTNLLVSLNFYRTLLDLYPYKLHQICGRDMFNVIPLQQQFPRICLEIVKTINNQDEELRKLITYIEQIITTVFVDWEDLVPISINHSKKIKISIITNLDHGTLSYIKNILTNAFRESLEINYTVHSFNQYQKIDEQKISNSDLTIVTFNTEKFSNQTIYVNDVLTYRDFLHIQSAINQYSVEEGPFRN